LIQAHLQTLRKRQFCNTKATLQKETFGDKKKKKRQHTKKPTSQELLFITLSQQTEATDKYNDTYQNLLRSPNTNG